MVINKKIKEILKQYNIDVNVGTLILLGIYHKLDIVTLYGFAEEEIKKVNLTKIVEKNYTTNTLTWNVSLYEGGIQGEFEWVRDWIDGFGKINMDRKGAFQDAVTRMKKFFTKYPHYRKDDVYKARNAYFTTVKDSQYLMKSHKFIFDGVGAMEKSTLLEWCEKTRGIEQVSAMKGKIM